MCESVYTCTYNVHCTKHLHVRITNFRGHKHGSYNACTEVGNIITISVQQSTIHMQVDKQQNDACTTLKIYTCYVHVHICTSYTSHHTISLYSPHCHTYR